MATGTDARSKRMFGLKVPGAAGLPVPVGAVEQIAEQAISSAGMSIPAHSSWILS